MKKIAYAVLIGLAFLFGMVELLTFWRIRNDAERLENISKSYKNNVTHTTSGTSLVFFHGFSATPRSIEPFPERLKVRMEKSVTKDADIHIFSPVLAGDEDRLESISFQNYVNDMEKNLSGKEKMILIGHSTGAVMVAHAIATSRYKDHIAGVVLISPNFSTRGVGPKILKRPILSELLLMVMPVRKWKAYNELHEKHWINEYNTKAVYTMIRYLNGVISILNDRFLKQKNAIPVLYVYTAGDQVCDHEKGRELINTWFSNVEIIEVHPEDADGAIDPDLHDILGDILSPGFENVLLDSIAPNIVKWLKGQNQ